MFTMRPQPPAYMLGGMARISIPSAIVRPLLDACDDLPERAACNSAALAVECWNGALAVESSETELAPTRTVGALTSVEQVRPRSSKSPLPPRVRVLNPGRTLGLRLSNVRNLLA